MSIADAEDALLARASAEFVALFARFVSDCMLADTPETDPHAQVADPWKRRTIHEQWRDALKQVGKFTAHTKLGAHGKIRVLRCCLEYGLATDEDVIVLVKSLALDLDRLLHDDANCACHLLAGSAAKFGTNL